MKRAASHLVSTASAKARRSPSPTKMMSTAVPAKTLTTNEVLVYVFSGINNISGCIQKVLNEDKFAEQKNIKIVPVTSADTTSMLEKAEIVVSEPKLIAPHLKNFKSLKWVQSTWAGVDAIFKQLKLDREEYERQQNERKKLQEALETQRKVLEEQKHELMAQLGDVEQALAQARVQVSGMTKQHLEELRSMNNPPAIVKFCLEAVAMLIVPNESHPMSWENIRKLTRRDDFIQNVLDFDGLKQNLVSTIATIKANYLSQPNFTKKAVEYASRACGPLMGWLEAQIQLGEMMSQNAPLFNKLKELQAEYDALVAKCGSFPALPVLSSVPSYQVTRLGGVFGGPMAEYVFGQILSLERDLPRLRKSQQESTWIPSNQYDYRPLSGLVIGIMGLGSIGAHIGFVARAFGMQVWGLVQDPSKHQNTSVKSENSEKPENSEKHEPDRTRIFTVASVTEFLAGVDYVINTLPNTPFTNNLLSPYKSGEEVQSLFSHATKKPVFINVGRGNIITEEAILLSLEKEWISHAVLDVFNEEPLPASSPLWTHPKVTVTPHVSAISKDIDVANIFKENMSAFLNGQPMSHVVNWEKEY
eukprot:Phypoly_transcript_05080.p1 GENE.Phypoly_transcript_05080~~Phypoly_transcript_05080.p1  ORF type:complete len:670 (+),score=133.24 Phypoly_transcript_05080:248-2011(+)